MRRRAVLYAEIADFTVSTDGRRVQLVAEEIHQEFGGRGPHKVRIIDAVQTLQVDVGHSRYPIAIGSGLLTNARAAGRSYPRPRPADRDQYDRRPAVSREADTAASPSRGLAECILPDGEQHKTLQTAGWVFDALVAKKMNRDATVLALGGGVVGDIAGFAAACYQRGDRLCANADHAAGAGRFLGRRQDRRQSCRAARI